MRLSILAIFFSMRCTMLLLASCSASISRPIGTKLLLTSPCHFSLRASKSSYCSLIVVLNYYICVLKASRCTQRLGWMTNRPFYLRIYSSGAWSPCLAMIKKMSTIWCMSMEGNYPLISP
jgi:hypothetical protein